MMSKYKSTFVCCVPKASCCCPMERMDANTLAACIDCPWHKAAANCNLIHQYVCSSIVLCIFNPAILGHFPACGPVIILSSWRPIIPIVMDILLVYLMAAALLKCQFDRFEVTVVPIYWHFQQ